MKGKIEYSNKLLGRFWTIEGTVKRGEKRGRKIGFPTCNIDLENYILPKLGVYSAKIIVNKNDFIKFLEGYEGIDSSDILE